MLTKIVKNFVVMVFILLLFTGTGYAQHFDATIPQGYWIEAWMMHFQADRYPDTDGHNQKMADGKNLDLKQDTLYMRFIYAGKYWVFDSHVPISRLEIGNVPGDDSSSGLGDIWLKAQIRNENAEKKWRPLGINISTGLGVKFPTGEYDRHDAVNLGSHQYDLQYDFRFSKFFFEGKPFGETGKWGIEGAVEYTYRFENQDTGVKPGNRIDWVIGPNVSVGKRIRVGWDIGGNIKERDESGSGRDLHENLGDSWGRKVSTGPNIYYFISPQVQLSAYSMFDIDARNEPKGYLVYLRWLFYWPSK